jgi:N6-adenosine-specific RNA methylase IME4
MDKFAIIYADPPWDYQGQVQHAGRSSAPTGGAASHYPTMTLPMLKRMRVETLAEPDALLFLWTSSPHMPQAIELMRAWGFEYMTVAFVWDKVKVNPGYYTMSQCELCLVGKRGKIPQPRGARNIRQLVVAERGAHSAKPEEVRRRIEAMFPKQSKVELFARTVAPGWRAWGNEIKPTASVPEGGPHATRRTADRPRLR